MKRIAKPKIQFRGNWIDDVPGTQFHRFHRKSQMLYLDDGFGHVYLGRVIFKSVLFKEPLSESISHRLGILKWDCWTAWCSLKSGYPMFFVQIRSLSLMLSLTVCLSVSCLKFAYMHTRQHTCTHTWIPAYTYNRGGSRFQPAPNECLAVIKAWNCTKIGPNSMQTSNVKLPPSPEFCSNYVFAYTQA